MSARSILTLFVVFFVAEFLWEQILTLLNMRFVRLHAKEVPEAFRNSVSEDVHRKSAEYTIAHGRYSVVVSTLTSALILVTVLTGALGAVQSWVAGWGVHPRVQSIIYILLLALAANILSLPFSYYAHFRLEARFGFNKMTPALFFADEVKGLLLGAVIIVPLLLALFAFMDSAGRFWWVYAFGFFTVFQLILSFLYPLVIAPLFNKFTPLEAGPLRDTLTALAERLRFRTKGIFIMDGSRRSGHSNAFFTGFGKAKRIVLFDTLVASMPADRIAAVLAHEIGHEKKRHILKSMALSLAVTGLLFFALGYLLPYEPLYRAFGFTGVSYEALAVIIAVSMGPFTFFLTPLFSAWSRKFEYEADRFAVDAVGSADPLSESLIALGKENLSTLTPHPLYSFYHYSHPTLPERIRAMKAHEGR